MKGARPDLTRRIDHFFVGVVGLEPTQLIATVLQTAMTLQLHRTPLCTFCGQRGIRTPEL